MRTTKIAVAEPFSGRPKINLAAIFGATPEKPFLLRIPATGERPMSFEVNGLPEGLELKDNIISGISPKVGEYEITLIAKNALGQCEKRITLEIKPQNVLVTPLLGFTSWNAYGSDVTQADILTAADRMVKLGLTEYGYRYVNTDSGWQYEYGGKFDAVMPNSKFPDMKQMTDTIHGYGLKCGIYSTPMLTAWGCPKEFKSIPGCTVGEPDYRFSDKNGGIGVIHKEANNVRQWDAWGFDYLKYDWSPCDTINADIMRKELIKARRDFGFCVTIQALRPYGKYWSEYCHSYRCNDDSRGTWEFVLKIYNSYFGFQRFAKKGHYFDLDMLDCGTCKGEALEGVLTEDEQIVAYTMRAFLNSPIQISSTLEAVDEFELSLYCNEEIIAINQDTAFSTPKLVKKVEQGREKLHIFEKLLEDGRYAYAVFNMGENERETELEFESEADLRDAWAKENIGNLNALTLKMAPHTVRVIKSDKKLTVEE